MDYIYLNTTICLYICRYIYIFSLAKQSHRTSFIISRTKGYDANVWDPRRAGRLPAGAGKLPAPAGFQHSVPNKKENFIFISYIFLSLFERKTNISARLTTLLAVVVF